AASSRSARILPPRISAGRIPICRTSRCRSRTRRKASDAMAMGRTVPRILQALALNSWLLFPAVAPLEARANTCAEPAPLHFNATSKIVRSETGFTQGLEFRDGQLYESTGRIGGT